jgi:hypothetical protein
MTYTNIVRLIKISTSLFSLFSEEDDDEDDPLSIIGIIITIIMNYTFMGVSGSGSSSSSIQNRRQRVVTSDIMGLSVRGSDDAAQRLPSFLLGQLCQDESIL